MTRKAKDQTKPDPLVFLKKIRVPWYARLLGWFRARKHLREALARHKAELDKPVYIATIFSWTWWTDTKYQSSAWYILREDGHGKRTYEYGTDSSNLKNDEKKTSTYPRVIAPWLDGHFSNKAMKEYAAKQKAPEPKA